MKVQVKLAVTAGLALVLYALAHPAAAANRPPAPEERTYFTIILGLDDELPAATCLTFGPSELCSGSGLCGSWRRSAAGPQSRRQASFAFELALVDDEGAEVRIDGLGRLDSRGPGSSIAAAARARRDGQRVNFSLAGRPSDPLRCAELADDFNRRVDGLDN